MRREFHLLTADGKYGNHRFLGPLRTLPCGKLVRLRRDRVLYGAPGPYGGQGRPCVHGDRFAFKEAETWPEATESVEFEDAHWGQVRLRRWDNLHAKQDAQTVFSVILAETPRERAKPAKLFWLGFQYPTTDTPDEPPLKELGADYHYRWPVEPSIRFRKQSLHWTMPRFQTPERCDRWTMLVTIAHWELFLARAVVQDQPLPWQPPQTQLTPELGRAFQSDWHPGRPTTNARKVSRLVCGTPTHAANTSHSCQKDAGQAPNSGLVLRNAIVKVLLQTRCYVESCLRCLNSSY